MMYLGCFRPLNNVIISGKPVQVASLIFTLEVMLGQLVYFFLAFRFDASLSCNIGHQASLLLSCYDQPVFTNYKL